MTSLPQLPAPDHLLDDARNATHHLRPAHILWLTHNWPTRIDETQRTCSQCCDLAAERDYEAIRRFAAHRGLAALQSLCWEVTSRGGATCRS